MNIDNEDYSHALNLIGESLLTALSQAVDKIPVQLRNRNIVSHGLSAFISNVIYKQFPNNQELCLKMLEELTKIIRIQLEQIPEASTNGTISS